MAVVLDSSMSLTWCLPEQGGVLSDRLLFVCRRERILVPGIWFIEMANILGLKHRDGNLSDLRLKGALGLLEMLPIERSVEVETDSIEGNLERIARHKIAAYDAVYVELALRTGSQLATYDKAMTRAAQRAGVRLLAAE